MKHVKSKSEFERQSVGDIANKFLLLLDEFIEQDKQKNKWLAVDCIHIYVRKSKRFYNGIMIDCLDLASIESDKTGTGLFTKILESIIEKYPEKNIYIESILSDNFYNFFKKYGFVTIGDAESRNLILLATA